MKLTTLMRWSMTALTALALNTGTAFAQLDHDSQPKHHDEPAPAAKVEGRVADPCPFDTCPTTGKKLGAILNSNNTPNSQKNRGYKASATQKATKGNSPRGNSSRRTPTSCGLLSSGRACPEQFVRASPQW